MNIFIDDNTATRLNTAMVRRRKGRLNVGKRHLNLSTRILYMLMIGMSIDGAVTIDYDTIIDYTGLSETGIKISIRELLECDLIERLSRGKYIIL